MVNQRACEIKYCEETILSFAQNNEDVLIFRALSGKKNGFFFDIGAGHPYADNVTLWLKLMGWRGVNVEPNPLMFKELECYRPSDINVNVGVAPEAGELVYYQVHQNSLGHGWGLSSFSQDAERLATDLGFAVERKHIPVEPLNSIASRLGVKTADVCKLDVEGLEADIIKSTDWRAFRPRLLCIESVRPNSAVPTWAEWEEHLLRSDYQFAIFDGINSYYTAKESDEILGQLSAAVNCNDRYRRGTVDDYPQ